MAQTKRSAKLDTRNARLKLRAGAEKQARLTPNQYLIYKRPKDNASGRWIAQWYDPEAGKKTKKLVGVADDYQDADGLTVLNYAQAQARAVEWFNTIAKQARIRAQGGEVVNVASFTVADALSAYFKSKERPGAKGAKGLKIAKQSAAAWIIPTLGEIPVAKLTKKQMNDWLDSVATSGRKTGGKIGSKPETDEDKRKRRDSANRILTILKAALNFVFNEIEELGDSVNPYWQRVKPYQETSAPRPRFLKEDEETRLINACPPDFRELVIAALETGCRYGELARLRVRDYNNDREIPSIHIGISKSGKPRDVDIGSERGVALFDELVAKKRRPDDLIFTHKVKRIIHGDPKQLAKFTEKRKERADMSREDRTKIILEGFEDAWRACDQVPMMKGACKMARIEPIGFHGLRHSYASMLIRGGANLSYVAAQLGHSDTRMVEKFYGHITPDDKAKAIQAAMAGRGKLNEPKFQKLKPRKLEIV